MEKKIKQRNNLAIKYQNLVYFIARKIHSNHTNIHINDLISSGNLGLLQAAEKYNPNGTATFGIYAKPFIYYAIIADLRSMCATPIATQRLIVLIRKSKEALIYKLGYYPSIQELENFTFLSQKKICEIEKHEKLYTYSLNKLVQNTELINTITTSIDIEKNIYTQETIKKIYNEIKKMPNKHKQIMFMYYQKNKTLKDISNVLNISFGRVNQIRKYCLKTIKKKHKEIHMKIFLIFVILSLVLCFTFNCEYSRPPLCNEETTQIYKQKIKRHLLKYDNVYRNKPYLRKNYNKAIKEQSIIHCLHSYDIEKEYQK